MALIQWAREIEIEYRPVPTARWQRMAFVQRRRRREGGHTGCSACWSKIASLSALTVPEIARGPSPCPSQFDTRHDPGHYSAGHCIAVPCARYIVAPTLSIRQIRWGRSFAEKRRYFFGTHKTIIALQIFLRKLRHCLCKYRY